MFSSSAYLHTAVADIFDLLILSAEGQSLEARKKTLNDNYGQ